MKKINIAMVDDSPFMLQVLERVLSTNPDVNIVGKYTSGAEILKAFTKIKPDVLILDFNMPGLDGIETLKKITKIKPTPAIFLTAHIEPGTAEALRAYEAGAVSIVAKPGESSVSLKEVAAILKKEIAYAAKADPQKLKGYISETLHSILTREKLGTDFSSVVIGASTGGPTILETVISSLPEKLNAAVLVALHLPENMEQVIVKRLGSNSKIKVKVAEDGEVIKRSMVYVSPAKHHLLIEIGETGDASVLLKSEESYSGAAPSIDMLFESVARLFGKKTIGVVLTGTGRDGLVGAKMIKELGGRVLTQKEGTAQAAGMSHIVHEHGLSDSVLAPESFAGKITEYAGVAT